MGESHYRLPFAHRVPAYRHDCSILVRFYLSQRSRKKTDLWGFQLTSPGVLPPLRSSYSCYSVARPLFSGVI